MQSAPMTRASNTWYGSMINSLRSIGKETASLTSIKYWSSPWKKSLSVSTDKQAAPCAS